MIKVIAGKDADRHHELMDRVFRFRHDFFVEGLKWTALRREDGREIDQFDTDECLHVVGLIDGHVSGYTRLLPTTRPHLLSEVYPHLLGGMPRPSGPDIWEWTRMSVDPARREGRVGTDRATAEIYLGVAETCLLHGIASVLIETHPIYLTRILETGWQARPLALPQEIDGQPVVPILAGVSQATLDRSRHVFGIHHSVLSPPEPARPESIDPTLPLEGV